MNNENSTAKKYNILVVFTGGTICSFANEDGERESDTERAQAIIVNNFRASESEYAPEERTSFVGSMPLDILSENMTTRHWNTLITAMKSIDYSAFDGIIILHGTDTLAYTAALLSMLMAGTKIPVFLVSSQLPPYEKEANGNANFRAAVELIVNGIEPNVYAVYRNAEIIDGEKKQTMYLHFAAHLQQCGDRSDNFYSADMTEISMENAVFKGSFVKENSEKAYDEKLMPLYECRELSPCVLRIAPYVGINYDWYSLEGVRAVLHGTYHSCTVAVDPYDDLICSNHAILSLKMRCETANPPIPLFLEPCNEDAYKYATTGIILRSGAKALWHTTSEMAYIKLLLGCSNGLADEALEEYLSTEINGEFVYKK